MQLKVYQPPQGPRAFHVMAKPIGPICNLRCEYCFYLDKDRFYDTSKVEKARVIMRLRQMEFSIEDIAAVLGECSDEADILNYLERQKNVLQQRIQEDRDIVRSLNEIIAKEKSAR